MPQRSAAVHSCRAAPSTRRLRPARLGAPPAWVVVAGWRFCLVGPVLARLPPGAAPVVCFHVMFSFFGPAWWRLLVLVCRVLYLSSLVRFRLALHAWNLQPLLLAGSSFSPAERWRSLPPVRFSSMFAVPFRVSSDRGDARSAVGHECCVQVVSLCCHAGGFPLAYEVLAGYRVDTCGFLKIEAHTVSRENLDFNRGSHREVLAEMREELPIYYLVERRKAD